MSQQNGKLPDIDAVRMWFQENFESEFPDYKFSNFPGTGKYSNGGYSLVLRTDLGLSHSECLQLGESSFEDLFLKIKSDTEKIGSEVRTKFSNKEIVVRINCFSSDAELMCTVSESGYSLDQDSPPIWGSK